MYNVFISQNVLLSDLLRLMSDRRTPNPGIFELCEKLLVNLETEVFDGWIGRVEDNWVIVIRNTTLWLSVNTNHFTVFPDCFKEFIKIPTMTRKIGEGKRVNDNIISIIERKEGRLTGKKLERDVASGR